VETTLGNNRYFTFLLLLLNGNIQR
jgi:hypothetical protein